MLYGFTYLFEQYYTGKRAYKINDWRRFRPTCAYTPYNNQSPRNTTGIQCDKHENHLSDFWIHWIMIESVLGLGTLIQFPMLQTDQGLFFRLLESCNG